jgi:hypothetical protein
MGSADPRARRPRPPSAGESESPCAHLTLPASPMIAVAGCGEGSSRSDHNPGCSPRIRKACACSPAPASVESISRQAARGRHGVHEEGSDCADSLKAPGSIPEATRAQRGRACPNRRRRSLVAFPRLPAKGRPAVGVILSSASDECTFPDRWPSRTERPRLPAMPLRSDHAPRRLEAPRHHEVLRTRLVHVAQEACRQRGQPAGQAPP